MSLSVDLTPCEPCALRLLHCEGAGGPGKGVFERVLILDEIRWLAFLRQDAPVARGNSRGACGERDTAHRAPHAAGHTTRSLQSSSV